MSDNDTTWGFDLEYMSDVMAENDTVTVDNEAVSSATLTLAAFKWGYSVDFQGLGPYRAGTYVYVVTGRDAADFVIRWEEENV